MRVKVCGITNYKDAALALDAGADALGFNFFSRSPRYIDASEARAIIRRLPPFAVSVGLFVNVEETAKVAEVAREACVQVLQLHGDESPAYCSRLQGWPLIKALRLDSGPVKENLRQYPVQAFLLDAKDDVRFGGTGRTFDWALAESVRKFRPVILAGGLKTENVGEAIRAVRPYGVDVCSGVESSPGQKDGAKLIAFMDEVRNASKTIQG
jgi:phosphoribosylanthranilate isomerase